MFVQRSGSQSRFDWHVSFHGYDYWVFELIFLTADIFSKWPLFGQYIVSILGVNVWEIFFLKLERY